MAAGASDDLSDNKFRRMMFGGRKQTAQWLNTVRNGLPELAKPTTNYNDIHNVDGVSVFVSNIPCTMDIGQIVTSIFTSPMEQWYFPVNCMFQAQVILNINKKSFASWMLTRNSVTLSSPFPSLFRTPQKSNFGPFFLQEEISSMTPFEGDGFFPNQMVQSKDSDDLPLFDDERIDFGDWDPF